MNFTIGSKVEWSSQSGGYTKNKTGVVVSVVPSGRNPYSWLPTGLVPNSSAGFGLMRNHESYLVQVGKSKRLYWPVVKRLKVAE